MFPYKDDNPRLMPPVVTLAIIGVTSLVWLVVQAAGSEPGLTESVCQLGAIPARLFEQPIQPIRTPRGLVVPCPDAAFGAWHTVVTSVFMHGGWFHLLGNMWFLWVFGDNVEDSMGHLRFVVFYLLCGVLAGAGQIVASPSSPVPVVGASGAISGIMGGYLVLYPRVRVHMIVFLGFFITHMTLPAYFMLLYWVFLQLAGSLPSLAGMQSSGGVAFLAHLAGFLAGALLIKLFSKADLVAAHHRHRATLASQTGGFHVGW